jgi:hypothetical protein
MIGKRKLAIPAADLLHRGIMRQTKELKRVNVTVARPHDHLNVRVNGGRLCRPDTAAFQGRLFFHVSPGKKVAAWTHCS